MALGPETISRLTWPTRNWQDQSEIEGIAYRPDIDGLRAIAVLAVVFYHRWGRLREGLPGSTSSFAISGYLITRIIADGIASGTFTTKISTIDASAGFSPAIYFILRSVLGLSVPGAGRLPDARPKRRLDSGLSSRTFSS